MTYRFFTSMFFFSSVVHAIMCAVIGKQFNIFVPIFVGLILSGVYDIYDQMTAPEVHTINIHQVDPEEYEDELTCDNCGSHDVKWQHEGKFYCHDCMKQVIKEDFEQHFKKSK